MKTLIKKHLQIPSPLQKLKSDLLEEKNLQLFVKRDDLIHKDISGNKWRKLKYNLLEARKQGIETIITFGGPYSNHLAATASACKIFGFNSIGYVRGDAIDKSTKSTKFLIANGMKLISLSRTQFRDLDNPEFIQSLKEKHPNSVIVPLGGTNSLALPGMAEMVTEIDELLPNYDYICTPIGSGGTAAGIIQNTKAHTLIFNTFKKDFTKNLIEPLLGDVPNWETINDYNFGGYVKTNSELIKFLDDFHTEFGFHLEYIYNGKMMYGLMDMIANDYFNEGDIIVAIHTGGLQGNLYL